MQKLNIFATAEETRIAVAKVVFAEIQTLLSTQPSVHIALTGGSDGAAITEFLDRELRSISAFPHSIHLWWSDERFVELDDSQRNDVELVHLQKSHGSNPALVIHRAPAPSQVVDIFQAVHIWRQEFDEACIDIAVVGVGPDGHIASLFPGLWNTSETADFLAVTNSPKPPARRLTMSFGLLSRTKHIIIAGTGSVKAPIFGAAVSKDFELPVTHLLNLPQAHLYLDTSAAANIDNTSAHLTTEKS